MLAQVLLLLSTFSSRQGKISVRSTLEAKGRYRKWGIAYTVCVLMRKNDTFSSSTRNSKYKQSPSTKQEQLPITEIIQLQFQEKIKLQQNRLWKLYLKWLFHRIPCIYFGPFLLMSATYCLKIKCINSFLFN